MDADQFDTDWSFLPEHLRDDAKTLPPKPLARFEKLYTAAEAAEGLRIRNVEKRHELSAELRETQAELGHLERSISRGARPTAQTAAEVVRLQKLIVRKKAEIVRLQNTHNDDHIYAAAANALTDAMKAGHILADAATKVDASRDDAEAALVATIESVAELHERKRQLRATTLPLEDIENQITSDVRTRARENAPDFSIVMAGRGATTWPQRYDNQNLRGIDSDALIFWAAQDLILDRALAEVRAKFDPGTAMSRADRDAEIAKVDSEIEALDYVACRLSELGGKLRVRPVARGELPVSGLAILDLVVVGTAERPPKPAPNKPLQHIDGPVDPAARLV